MSNFYQRIQAGCASNKGNNFIGFINTILNLYPELRIRESSLLYKAAINQYNTQAIKNPTTERMPVPSWFCGYIDPKSGFLYTSQPEIIQTKASILEARNLSSYSMSISSDVYPIDRCLEFGQPGNLDYSFCEIAPISSFYLSQINWASAFYPTDIISRGIDRIENTVAQNIQQAIEFSSGNNSGGGGSEVVGGGTPDGPNADKGVKLISVEVTSNRKIVINSSGVAANWGRKGNLYASICLNGRRFDDLKNDQVDRVNGVKTLDNIYNDPDYRQNIKYGDKVEFKLRSISGKYETDDVSAIWKSPDVFGFSI